MDISTTTASADQAKEELARNLYQFKRELQLRAANARTKVPGQIPPHEREKRAADAVAQLRDTLDLSLEQQVATQLACITQSALDCMIRASANGDGVLPADARQSIRHAELQDQARLHDSGSRMLEALTRMRGNSAFTFTVNHLRDGDAPTPHAKS
jgi:hypothetical protein